jgi:hypothetical protein
MSDKGPVYGVQLIDTLPLGQGGMLQQLPCRSDLEKVCKVSYRTAAGYEVLLSHYLELFKRTIVTIELQNAISRLRAMTADGQQSWDLSHNDVAALKLILETLTPLLKEPTT